MLQTLRVVARQQRRLQTAKHAQSFIRMLNVETSSSDADSVQAAAIKNDGVIASISLAQATENEQFKFFPFKQETENKIIPEGINKRTEEMFELIGHRHLMLRENTLKIISFMKDWENSRKESNGAFVIDGERGCGKTIALQQIVQFARENEWLVLYIPHARSWCFDAPYVVPSQYNEGKFDIDAYGVALLEKFYHCHAEQLGKIPLHGNYGDRYYPESLGAKPKEGVSVDRSSLTLRDLVANGIQDEDLACAAVVDLRAELAHVAEFPVLIAIDEYNSWFGKTVFGYDNVDVKPKDISVVNALLELGTEGLKSEQRLKNGLVIAATTENYPTKADLKKCFSYKPYRMTMKPYTHQELESVVAYYNQVHFLHDKPTPSQLAYFRLMTKSVPMHVLDRASFS